MTFSASLSTTLARVAHWPLRIALSSVFFYHGMTKFPHLDSLADMMGLPVVAVAMLACIEVSGAVLIVLGGFGNDRMTRLGGLLIAPVMLGAIFMVHLQHGWNSVNMGSGNMGRGMEFQFTLLMIALYFVFRGNPTDVREQRETEQEILPSKHDHDQPRARRTVRKAAPTSVLP